VRVSRLHVGDLVEVDVRGFRFEARLLRTPPGDRVEIEPVNAGVSYRSCTSRQIVRSLEPRGRRRQPGQFRLPLFDPSEGRR
jgi:hypothetical protein